MSFVLRYWPTRTLLFAMTWRGIVIAHFKRANRGADTTGRWYRPTGPE
jgi:hypothetical protein